jgi:hypothetical protein
MTTDGGGWTKIVVNGPAIAQLGNTFNAIFGNGQGKTIRVQHEYIAYYHRKTPYSGNAYDSILSTWRNTNNAFHTDFEIYSTYTDLINGTNPWQYCNFSNEPVPEHTLVGFPRDCGPTGGIGSRWINTEIPRSGFTAWRTGVGAYYQLWIR